MFLWSLIPLSITYIWNLGKIIDIKQSDFSVPWSNSISKLSSLLKNELKIHLIIWYNLSKTRSRRKWWHQYSFSGSELNNVWDYNFSRTSEKNLSIIIICNTILDHSYFWCNVIRLSADILYNKAWQSTFSSWDMIPILWSHETSFASKASFSILLIKQMT